MACEDEETLEEFIGYNGRRFNISSIEIENTQKEKLKIKLFHKDTSQADFLISELVFVGTTEMPITGVYNVGDNEFSIQPTEVAVSFYLQNEKKFTGRNLGEITVVNDNNSVSFEFNRLSLANNNTRDLNQKLLDHSAFFIIR